MKQVRSFQDADAAQWDAYVRSSPAGNCYQLVGWKRVIEQSFGHKTYYRICENDDRKITGIIPIVHLKSWLFGSFMVSLPYFNYGGICADEEESYELLLSEAKTLAARERARHIEFREHRLIQNGLQSKESKVAMVRPLPESVEGLWKSLGSKLRSQVKRPEREGIYARLGREELVDQFYAVFSENMRDLGTPVYAKAFFENILREFPATSWICVVYTKEARPIAAGFLVGFKHALEIPWASSLRAYNHHAPNMFLYWMCLKFACESGYKYFDFGRSTPHEGTYRFKQQWGAEPSPLYWYYWTIQGGPLPQLNPHNPKFMMAINIWKKLPLSITRLIGPAVVKNLP
jgi:serine/alanine adding enzyme